MNNRRAFLQKVGAWAALYQYGIGKANFAPAASLAMEADTSATDLLRMGFKPHLVKQGDGSGGWIEKAAEIQYLNYGKPAPYYEAKGDGTMLFGVAQMDNGEVVAIGTWDSDDKTHTAQIVRQRPIVGFSRDQGATWTDLTPIEGGNGRPMMLTYLGKGNLMFQTDLVDPIMQYFSHDYGRTWPERQPLQRTTEGKPFFSEGNALVDRDAHGVATRIAQLGGHTDMSGSQAWPQAPTEEFIRWSSDGGRNWTGESQPAEWRSREEYQGKTYARGCSEGSLVRAANGWLVAALRMDMDPQFFPLRSDNLEGIGVSVSKDNGKTWTAVHRLYHAGRMHAHLILLPNRDILLTHIERQDIDDGGLASYRRGCGAVISHDNGLTWDMAHRYILDGFDFSDNTPMALACGHQYSTLLSDGRILTCYSNYTTKCGVIIRWQP